MSDEQTARPWHVGYDDSAKEWVVIDPRGERHAITRGYLVHGFDKWLQETLEELEASWVEQANARRDWNNDTRTRGLQTNLLAANNALNALESRLQAAERDNARYKAALTEWKALTDEVAGHADWAVRHWNICEGVFWMANDWRDWLDRVAELRRTQARTALTASDEQATLVTREKDDAGN